MSITFAQLETIIGNLVLLEDGHPTHNTAEFGTKFHELQALIATWEAASDQSQAAIDARAKLKEIVWMLATFCFDVSKRFDILHFAVVKIAADAQLGPQEDLRTRVEGEKAALNGIERGAAACRSDRSWADRAMLAATQLQGWHDDVVAGGLRAQVLAQADAWRAERDARASALVDVAERYRALVGPLPEDLRRELPAEVTERLR